ncbi:MAG: hypothetical protein K0R25_627 [Rickettsiaceae bacterium]|jgi:hypothetical protein|nr:hypothetical protein [Rickettsiaceae bacterium]
MLEAKNSLRKSRKFYFSAIFWIALVIFTYFAARYFISEFKHRKDSASEIQDTDSTKQDQSLENPTEADKTTAGANEQTLNSNDILLKQQLQISELQKNYNDLKLDVEKLKTNNELPKIILSFVKLQDLVSLKQNYNNQLQKLEVLCRADFALTAKISKLKIALQNQPKSNMELAEEFSKLIPKINAKRLESEGSKGWIGKIKAFIGKFIIIKRTDGKGERANFDALITDAANSIANQQYDKALQAINLLGSQYASILSAIEIDLQNADYFQKTTDEIYQYLQTLSN